VRERVHGQRRPKLLELERERRINGLDAVDHDRQPHFRGRAIYEVVHLVAVEDLQPRRRQVGASELAPAAVAPDVLRASLRILRRAA
jgi:hypothetical protein